MKGEDLNIMENWPINLLFLIKCNKNHVVLLKKSIFSILTSKQCQSKNTSATHKHTEFISYQTFNKTLLFGYKMTLDKKLAILSFYYKTSLNCYFYYLN